MKVLYKVKEVKIKHPDHPPVAVQTDGCPGCLNYSLNYCRLGKEKKVESRIPVDYFTGKKVCKRRIPHKNYF